MASIPKVLASHVGRPNLKICKAKGCTTRFEAKGFICWCSYACGAAIAQERIAKRDAKIIAAKIKDDKRQIRERKAKLKTRSDWIKETQIVFNKYIRHRDREKQCICCRAPLTVGAVGGGFDCGHYRSVGSAPHLRFDERNAHGQTKRCNRWGSGRAVDYRRGLIERIGVEAVESLESDQQPKHYTIDGLKEIISLYKQKTKQLLKT